MDFVVSNLYPERLPLKDGGQKKGTFLRLGSGLTVHRNMESRQHRLNQRYAMDDRSVQAKMALANRVKILNISLGGLSLEADKRLNIGREYSLHLEHKGKKLSIKGCIMWSLLTVGHSDGKGNVIPTYRAGMKFSKIPEGLSDIIAFIKQKQAEGEQSLAEEYYHISLSAAGAMELPTQHQGYFNKRLIQGCR
jgi:hypothetical protein